MFDTERGKTPKIIKTNELQINDHLYLVNIMNWKCVVVVQVYVIKSLK